ncbi:hypothetical protein Cagg_2056 [Chloroflexus aggregans DSM 9485]|uniref:Uncharacterized protein n=1 Tax=Chloroflexus aggregans (strain MD-66 / DSM 9485) TaxID=326427 RepID=B8GBX7_CHLAD|nr:hypothetical protein Cagg_2056 [Chloroflexus aggregans DSM 9485]
MRLETVGVLVALCTVLLSWARRLIVVLTKATTRIARHSDKQFLLTLR